MATTTINDSCATQVQIIDGEGVFNVTGLDNFIKTSDMANTGLNYAVVGIIGPQSSGKSTLMNLLFHTRFKEMDASKGRSQTTKGIWIDKCTGIKTCTIALDIEGTDGRERGEDDTAFEKQSALFALAVSDIVLINLWCHDVGREQAASKPLLRTVFQAMLPLLTSPRKITLIFVLRDKTPKTPLESLESILREDIQKIWNEIPKPKAHIHTPLGNFFNVEVTSLSNYETQEEEFKKEVSELRKRFYHSIAPGGLAGDRCDVVPASGFSISAQKIWKSIQENKDLNLPAHKVMVSTMRCEAIAKEKLDHLRSNQGWLKLMEAAQSGLVQGFGKKLNSIIGTYRSQYDEETEFYDEAVRNAKWKQLESDALNEAYLSYTTMIGHLRSKALADFKTKLEKSLNNGEGFTSSVRMCTQSIMLEFEKGSADTAPGQTNWNVSKVQDELRSDIDSHAELLGKFFCSDNDSHAELLKRKPPLKVFCSDNDSHAELLERKPRLKKAEKSAKTLKLVKEVAIATAVGAAVGVAGMSGMAAVIALTGGAAAVGTGAVAVSVVALAAPVLSVMYSVYEITNKYKNRAKPVKGRA